MKKMLVKAVVMVAACMATAAQAQLVDWHLEGVVASLGTPQFIATYNDQVMPGSYCNGCTTSVTGYTPVASIGQLSVGQAFASDFVVNLATNSIVSASLKTADGSLSYKTSVSPFMLNTGTVASIKGDLFASNANAKPPMLYGLTVTANGTGLTGAASLSDINQVLATGAYTSVTASSLLYPGYAPLYTELGQAAFTITSVAVVPETSTLPMLSIGLVGLACIHRRKKLQQTAQGRQA